MRILFMVPIYATVSWLSYTYYQKSVYFEVLRDCYEAFAIASFFTLLCHYLAQDLHDQKNYFRTVKPKHWIWPIPWVQKCWGGREGTWRTPRSGLTWFNVSQERCRKVSSADHLPGRLDWCLPILLHPCVHDYCRSRHPSFWPILPRI